MNPNPRQPKNVRWINVFGKRLSKGEKLLERAAKREDQQAKDKPKGDAS